MVLGQTTGGKTLHDDWGNAISCILRRIVKSFAQQNSNTRKVFPLKKKTEITPDDYSRSLDTHFFIRVNSPVRGTKLSRRFIGSEGGGGEKKV